MVRLPQVNSLALSHLYLQAYNSCMEHVSLLYIKLHVVCGFECAYACC